MCGPCSGPQIDDAAARNSSSWQDKVPDIGNSNISSSDTKRRKNKEKRSGDKEKRGGSAVSAARATDDVLLALRRALVSCIECVLYVVALCLGFLYRMCSLKNMLSTLRHALVSCAVFRV
jgi:hypothetical protein